MTDSRALKIQQVFLAALDIRPEKLDAWLRRECGSDSALITEVRSLLDHAEPSLDPLEQNLDEVIADIPRLDGDDDLQTRVERDQPAEINPDDFLSKLTEVGVLSPDELASVNDSISTGDPSTEPRQIASRLVSEGKLTEYQASALLKGEPELLIDKYLILDLIDVGGMGMVFKAIHRSMNRVVAVKMISHQMLGSADLVKRFQREVRVAATLEHPNIVRAYDADESRGINFLVMEYVRGDNIDRIVRTSGPLPLPKTVDYIRQAALGLQHAHERGIVHRDVKPGNLLLDDRGVVKILDLGLAHIDKSLSLNPEETDNDSGQPYVSRTELTAAGAVLGTASFMAPEQSLDAHFVDFRSDIYSLGCTLYYLLTGDTPYSGSTVFKVFVEHREAAIPSLKDKRPDVPDSIDAIFRRMVAKKLEDRFRSIAEFLVALDDCRIAPPVRKARTTDSAASPAAAKESITLNTDISESPTTGKQPVTIKRLIAFSWLWAPCAAAAVVLIALSWTRHDTAQNKTLQMMKGDSVTSQSVKHSPDRRSVDGLTTHSEISMNETQVSGADLLASGQWEWRVEKNLGPTINSPAIVFGADMTADRRTIVYSSLRQQQPPGNRDLWIATRSSPEEPWSEPVRLPPEINTDSKEEQPRLSSDGLSLWFRGDGNALMHSVRENVDAPWSKALLDPYSEGPLKNYDTTPNGLTAFRSGKLITDQTQTNGKLTIWWREGLDSPFYESSEYLLPILSPIQNSGTLSDDAQMYIFATEIDNGKKARQTRLFYSTRAVNGDSWSAPSLLFSGISGDEVSSGSPRLLDDNRSLLFTTNMQGGQGSFDIWLAKLVPKNSQKNSQ